MFYDISHTMIWSRWLAVLILSVPIICAEPRFDMVSIHRSPQSGRVMDSVVSNLMKSVANGSWKNRFRMEGLASVPLSMLIRLAYKVEDFQMEGLPSWGNSERYAIVAKAPDDATFEQMRPMIGSLLADRFQLKFHRETRELPVYLLTIARGGLKILAAKQGECLLPDHCGGVVRQRDSIEATGISMTKLAELLSNEVGRPVLDKTGFAETFNLHLNFSPDMLSGGDPAAPDT